MVPAAGERTYIGGMGAGEELLDLGMGAFEFIGLADPGVADVRDGGRLERARAGGLVYPAHQARLIAHLPRAMARPRTVGHPAIIGNTADADLRRRVGEVLNIRQAEEGGETREARALHRVIEGERLGIGHGRLGRVGSCPP